jgi:fumarate hydratase class II
LDSSLLNFQIGGDSEIMPKEIIMAMAVIKKAAARVNSKMNGLEGEIAQAIEKAADEVKPRPCRAVSCVV